MKSQTIILLIILLFISLLTSAQNDTRIKKAYIIDTDTIYGEVKVKPNMHSSILFKPLGNEKFLTINTESIKALSIENKQFYKTIRYKSETEIRTQLFLQLAKGKLCLYRGEKDYLLEKDGQFYHLEYEGAYVEDQVPKIDVRFKVVLLKVMEDCENIFKKVRSAVYSDNSLTRVVDYYNKQMSGVHEVYTQKTIVRKGIKIGTGVNTIRFPDQRSEYKTYKYEWNSVFNFGFFVNFSKLDKPLSLQTELLVSMKNTVMSKDTDQFYRKIEVKSTQIQVPVIAYYKLPYKKITPVVSLGVVTSYEINRNSMVIDENWFSDRLSERNFDMGKFSIGFRAGLGTNIQISKKNFLLEYNYEHLYSNFDYVVNESRFKSHTISLGFDI